MPTTPVNTRTIRDFLTVHDLLVFLGDGHVEIVTGADGKPQRGKTTPHNLGLKGRYAVLKDRTQTEKVAKRVQTLRDERITELSGGSGTLNPETDADKIALLQEELDTLLDTEETLNLHQIPIEDLKLDQNPHITDSIVLALGDLVSEPAS